MSAANLTKLINQVLELDKKATPGSWYLGNECKLYDFIDRLNEHADVLGPKAHHACGQLLKTDAELIAHYRTSAPKLARALKILLEAFPVPIPTEYGMNFQYDFDGMIKAIAEAEDILK